MDGSKLTTFKEGGKSGGFSKVDFSSKIAQDDGEYIDTKL